MPDTVLNALRQKLERYEAAGMPDEVKRVKARIAQEEKAEKAPAVLSMTAPVKPTVKKLTKTTKPRKKN